MIAKATSFKAMTVKFDHSAYPIFIGAGLLAQPSLLMPYLAGEQLLIVTDPTIAALHLETLLGTLPKTFSLSVLQLPGGEAHKNIQTIDLIFDVLLKEGHRRHTTLIALGGGVIGDMTGFAAACYQRGVAFIQIPTTLLAQVDSSIGGKTGVNHKLGKNMIGAFHQPRCVIIDTDVLATLPPREFHAGLAEVIKHALIADADFFVWLEKNIQDLLAQDSQILQEAIFRSCQIKARIVALDEKEQGLRAHLNLGHTFGHSLEHTLGYGVWLHGEAVAVGLVLAIKLSVAQGWIEADLIERLENLLKKIGLPIRFPPTCTPEQLLTAMLRDKKNNTQQIRLVLLKKLGEACITDTLNSEEILELLRQ